MEADLAALNAAALNDPETLRNVQGLALERFLREVDSEVIKGLFDAAITSAPNEDVADDRRFLKAYFTDKNFRAGMTDHIAEILEG